MYPEHFYPMKENIKYTSEAIELYFKTHRIKWDELYESERQVISALNFGPGTSVLDIGCGCGGLGLILEERFGVVQYLGVEINRQAAETARVKNPKARFVNGDFAIIDNKELSEDGFDRVFSLSCIDWNVRFEDMLPKAFACVKPGGYFIASLRITDQPGLNDLSRSYQYINYDGQRCGELAAYVVLNAGELLKTLLQFRPDEVLGYGYWGKPSASAVTPYERLCFSVFAIRKGLGAADGVPKVELNLPPDLKASLGYK